jgi:hypothetical protein
MCKAQEEVTKKTVYGIKYGFKCPSCNKFVAQQDAWWDKFDGNQKHKHCINQKQS